MTSKKLKHIAPFLASLANRQTGLQNKKAGFTVPDSYFDRLEDSITTKLVEKLLPKKSGYVLPDNYLTHVEETVYSKLEREAKANEDLAVPEAYFDTLEDTVFARLEKEKKNRVFSIKKHWIPAAIAASIVLFFTIYNPLTITKNKEIEEITNWIEDGNLDLDSYQIAEFYNSDLESFEIQNTISTETLENYIMDKFTEDAFYN